MASAGRYYEESGRFDASRLARSLLLGVPAAAILGAVYGVASYAVPIPLLALLAGAVVARVLGTWVDASTLEARVRSTWMVVGFALTLGALAAYACLVVWTYLVTGGEYLVLAPDAMSTLLGLILGQRRLSYGTMGRPGGLVVEGAGLRAAWALEAVVLLGVLVHRATRSAKHAVFCEECQAWVAATVRLDRAGLDAPGELVRALDKGDWQVLDRLPVRDPGSPRFTRLELRGCPTCQAPAVLSVSSVREDPDGRWPQVAPVVEGVLIPRERFDAARSAAEGAAS